MCGRSDARISEQETVEYDDVTYLGDGRVEVVTARNRDGTQATAIRDFDEWARGRCARVAGQAVLNHVQNEVREPDAIGGGHGKLVEEYDGIHAFIQYTANRDDDDPAVSFAETADHTPPQASITVELEDQRLDCTIPVYVIRREPTTPD